MTETVNRCHFRSLHARALRAGLRSRVTRHGVLVTRVVDGEEVSRTFTTLYNLERFLGHES